LTGVLLSDNVYENDRIGNYGDVKVKLSTRGRYGTRALLELALHHESGLVLLKDIARKQQISQRYLEHVIRPLVAGGIVRSTRGAGGGIALARPPEDIKMSEVIQLLEGSIAPTDCVTDESICSRSDVCATRDIWCEISQAVNKVLESTSLKDLLERQKEKGEYILDIESEHGC
jgi:Rrf2 family cysteine metabolism transcriptional repressor